MGGAERAGIFLAQVDQFREIGSECFEGLFPPWSTISAPGFGFFGIFFLGITRVRIKIRGCWAGKVSPTPPYIFCFIAAIPNETVS